MTEFDITIINRLGLHARAAAKLVNLASGFESKIDVQREHRKANAKSIMGVMMLAAAKGVEIKFVIQGVDETQAAQAIKDLIHQRFGEEE